jgi:hypothetical protein
MDTWVWLVIFAAAAAVLFSLAWWSSGRSKARGRGPENSLTQDQVEGIYLNKVKNQTGIGPIA